MPAQGAKLLVDRAGALVALEDAVGDPVRDDRFVRCAGLQQFRRQAIQAGIAVVADDQTLVAVEHAQAMGHVFERGIEAQIGFFQRQLPADGGGNGGQLKQRQYGGGGKIGRPMLLVTGNAAVCVRHDEDEADPKNGDDRQTE